MPALGRARVEAEKTRCRANVHNAGIAFGTYLVDSDGYYPGWVTQAVADVPMRYYKDWMSTEIPAPRHSEPTNGSPFYQLLQGGYLDDIDVYDCPSCDNPDWWDWTGPEAITPDWEDPADWHWPPFGLPTTGWHNGGYKYIRFAEYSYDLGRISRNSVAGRVIYGDSWARMYSWGNPGWGYWPYNHSDGSNVLYVDLAVEFAHTQDEDQTFRCVADADLGYYFWTYDGLGWRRDTGLVPNPRMDEDEHLADAYGIQPESLVYPYDNDDIYFVEGDDVNIQNAWCWGAVSGAPRAHDRWTSWNNAFIIDAGGGAEYVEGWSWWGYSRYFRWWDAACIPGFYPEKGRFAGEARWDRRDACLVPFSVVIPGVPEDGGSWYNSTW
jgi:prepilin-type processing-associated H-X9-DG protein